MRSALRTSPNRIVVGEIAQLIADGLVSWAGRGFDDGDLAGMSLVIVASDDIYGHGVNVAARLESLAPPGGICISADAWRHVRGAIAADFVDLGEQRLKNIADPAHVFAISPAA